MLLWLLAGVSPAATLTVCTGGGCDYSDWDVAVAAAFTGDTLAVEGAPPAATNVLIDKDLTVDGTLATGSVTGGGLSRFEVSCAGCTVTFEALDLDTGGVQGLWIFTGSIVVLRNVTIDDSGSLGWRGITVDGATLTIENSVFSNIVGTTGAAIIATNTALSIDGSDFTDNAAGSGLGGAISARFGSVSISNSSFVDNSAQDVGGAVAARDLPLTVTDSVFVGNVSGSNGGAIRTFEAPLVMLDNYIAGNSAWGGGGVSIVISSTPTVEARRNTICGNIATGRGGAVHAQFGTQTWSNNAFALNGSGQEGGAFYLQGSGSLVSFEHNAFAYNDSQNDLGDNLFDGTANTLMQNNAFVGAGGGTSTYGLAINNDSLDYNLWFANPVDVVGHAIGPNAQFTNPLFTDASGATPCSDLDVWPRANSPMIDNGGGLDGDLDGSAPDIGISGGPYADPNRFDGDGDGFPAATDCDDADPARNPGATEVCDPTDIDEDCDGLSDNADPSVSGQLTYWPDGDGDGFGDGAAVVTCEAPSNSATIDGDCDDAEPTAFPGGIEVCGDNIDNDCADGVDDPGAVDAQSWYEDGDGDGFGSPAVWVVACVGPPEWVVDSNDCDDGVEAINPGAEEVCDDFLVDENCNGQSEEAGAIGERTWYADADADGYGVSLPAVTSCAEPPGHVGEDGDCADSVAAINPGADEVCDGEDNDCDLFFDEDAVDAELWYRDADGDGFGDASVPYDGCDPPGGYVQGDIDCNDENGGIFPGATDAPDDGVDQDCDGVDAVCDADDDGDPRPDCGGGDCDDLDAAIGTGFLDIPYDGIDQDCDGADLSDVDGDGVDGGPDGADCDDGDPTVFPGADEIPYDGLDSDCDGQDLCDVDGDGWDGQGCGGEDCDDEESAVNPGAEDLLDLDRNCNGSALSSYLSGNGLECGCTSGGTPAVGWLWLVGLLLARRRR